MKQEKAERLKEPIKIFDMSSSRQCSLTATIEETFFIEDNGNEKRWIF